MMAGADSVRLTHPRLRELEAKVSRYELAARAARRETWPDLELRASYGQRGALQGGPDQNDMFSATVGFTVPVFAPARELSEGAEMDAMARAADAERRAVELELREQVEATRAALSGSMRTASLLADTVVVTQKRALDASWSAYTAGTTDLWRVFEAAHTLYSDEVELARTRQEIARLEARWLTLAASGQGLSVKIPEPARDGAENAAGGRSQP
jgi:outer membrane protein TolC